MPSDAGADRLSPHRPKKHLLGGSIEPHSTHSWRAETHTKAADLERPRTDRAGAASCLTDCLCPRTSTQVGRFLRGRKRTKKSLGAVDFCAPGRTIFHAYAPCSSRDRHPQTKCITTSRTALASSASRGQVSAVRERAYRELPYII